ncbi:hypothetical protein LOAG_12848 [Loa loa]|uniref:Uncharacterized protein n=1 Tax=Loa loa TaxID=7209 RepID=A0A1S0TKJ0_LOALO|nr:hypothetical protein LOAG_12848 [Loa loa]EFO15662.1 hypothetical protein LOAG_12848 [Loa loa]
MTTTATITLTARVVTMTATIISTVTITMIAIKITTTTTITIKATREKNTTNNKIFLFAFIPKFINHFVICIFTFKMKQGKLSKIQQFKFQKIFRQNELSLKFQPYYAK